MERSLGPRTELVFSESTMTAPPLIHWYAARRGWRHESPPFLPMPQLERLDNLKPTASYVLSNEVFSGVGLYGAALSQIFVNATTLGIGYMNNNGRHITEWYARPASASKSDVAPIIYTCHSMQAELFIAIYNVAAAAMQKAVTMEHILSAHPEALPVSAKLMRTAYEILISLKDLAAVLRTSSHFAAPSPPQTPAVMMKLLESGVLETLSMLAHAQYLELQLLGHREHDMLTEVIALGIAIVGIYNTLYERISDEAEFLCSSPGYLRRLVAIKRHYYRMVTTIHYIDRRPDVPTIPSLLFTTAAAAKETLKSVDKNRDIVAGIAAKIVSDVQMVQERYALTNAASYEDGSDYWANVISVMSSVEVPGDAVVPSLGFQALAERILNMYSLRLFILTVINDSASVAERMAPDLNREMISRVEDLTRPTPSSATAPSLSPEGPIDTQPQRALSPPSQPAAASIQCPPQFSNHTQLYRRLRRLGMMLKSLAAVSAARENLPQGFQHDLLPITERLIGLAYTQCMDYILLINHAFFDNSTLVNPAIRDHVVDLQTITTLAHTTPRVEGATPLDSVDLQGILSNALDDRTVMDAILRQVETIEESLRIELLALEQLMVQLYAPPPSSLI